MTRRCSNCSHCGHNSRTCPDNRAPMLFGVRLTEGGIRKSSSMGSLSVASPPMRKSSSLGSLSESSSGLSPGDESANLDVAGRSPSSPPERKKGTPWTEEEHRGFLVGLKKLGQGAWRGISRNYVISRTPTQVASHAQKHFIRQANVGRTRRRSSLFDIVAAENAEVEIAEPEAVEPQSAPLDFQILEAHKDDCLQPKVRKEASREAFPMLNEQCQSIDATKLVVGEANHKKPQTTTLYRGHTCGSTSVHRGFHVGGGSMQQVHEIMKPSALRTMSPVNDETISNLNIGSSTGGTASQPPLLDEVSNHNKQLTCQ